jgi:hypothetical protein
LDGVTAAEMGVQVGTVDAALIGATLEVLVLVEDYLKIVMEVKHAYRCRILILSFFCC